MGNTNTKPLSSLASPTKKSAGGIIQDLKEDITCSICLGPFEDPISIDCGHNFCKGCLSAHWSGYSRHGDRCPECRHPCSRERMIPDTRLRSLVEKIGQIPVKEVVEKELDIQESGKPVQLVGLDDNGVLCLDEEALSHCLEQGQVKDTPVCLVSILGEQRRGKSFLLNFLLRRLQNLEAEDESWMGQEDETLTGFEWRPGPTTTTKGIWIWSRPFWVQREHEKIAIFLVDTEGSMDVERNVEDSVKLSAFSMLLSSYQIFNLPTMIKDPDLEYLEMFMFAAETVGGSCRLKPFQHLDVLVRDWFYPPVFGFQGGQNYLQSTIQKLDPKRHPRALEALRSTSTRCYLMPFPGRKLLVGTEGTLADMDKDFRDCLKAYVNDIAKSAGTHVKRYQEGRALTGAQLVAKVKKFCSLMKKCEFGFSSVTQMAITLHNLGTQEKLQQEFADFIINQDELRRPLISGLRMTPKSMTQCLLDKQRELKRRCEESLQGDEPCRRDSILSLEKHLEHEAQIFMKRYHRRYKSHALKAGMAIGIGAVGLAGGAIGAGVAAAVLATEAIVLSTGTAATVAIGTMTGAGTFAVIGGGVGAGVGNSIGERKTQEAKNMIEDDPEGEEETSFSDEKCLIGQGNSP